uniref:Uncharacterized protein n=1 Tax=Amphora coffeiformis TaxID=265554 RepID=A0A7S3L2C1_9STRA
MSSSSLTRDIASVLVTACQAGNASEVKSISDEYPDAVRYADESHQGYTALHHALEAGASLDVVRALVTATPDVVILRTAPPYKCTALHVAAACPATTAALVDYLLTLQPTLATQLDGAGRSALHYVCQGSSKGQQQKHASIDVVRALYQAWKEATYVMDQQGYLPIHLSYLTGAPGSQLRYLASLDPRSVSVPLPNKEGRLVAHAVATDLLQQPSNSNTTTTNVLESLVLADPATLFEADPTSGKTLVQTAQDPAFTQKLGSSAVRFQQIIQTHRKPDSGGFGSGDSPKSNKKGSSGKTDEAMKKGAASSSATAMKQKVGLPPEVMADDLVMACSQNLTEKVRLVVHACPEAVRIRDQEGFWPLHWACYHGASVDILKLLLGSWPESVRETISQNRLPLHLACRQSASPEAIHFLVEKYPQALEATTTQGMLPLHYACRDAAPLDVVKYLIDQAPMTVSEQTTNNAALPIHLACKHGKSPETVQFLAETWPACLREHNSEGLLPIHFLCKAGSTVSLEWMATQDPGLLEISDCEGNLPLHWLCKNPKATVEAVKMIVDVYPEAVAQTNKAGMTPADLAEDVNMEIASFLSMRRKKRRAGPNPLHQACSDPRVTLETVMNILTESPDEVCVPDEERNLPIHVACRTGASLEVIRYLAEDWPESLRWTNKGGSIPLHTACSNQPSAAVIHYLITSWPKATSVANNYGWLSLHCACAYGASPEVISLLVRSNDKSSRMATYGQGDYPLHLACCGSPSLEVIYWLIEAREEGVRLANTAGELALHKACFNNAPLEVIQFLVEQYPDSLFVEDQHGATPQNIAEMRRNYSVAGWLKSKEV